MLGRKYLTTSSSYVVLPQSSLAINLPQSSLAINLPPEVVPLLQEAYGVPGQGPDPPGHRALDPLVLEAGGQASQELLVRSQPVVLPLGSLSHLGPLLQGEILRSWESSTSDSVHLAWEIGRSLRGSVLSLLPGHLGDGGPQLLPLWLYL